MSAMATMKDEPRFLGLPKNRTGLFAADTLRDVKPNRQALISVPALSPQYRANGSKNLLLATAEQNHHQLQQYLLSSHEIQQYYPLHATSSSTTVDTANYSRPTTTGIRNGFRPSAVRRHNMRLMSASAQRSGQLDDMRETSLKQPFVPSHASARLRSEIEQISQQLKRHGDSAKPVRDPLGREAEGALHSALSFATSGRLSSASSIPTADRIHQRFSSAITNVATNACPPKVEHDDTAESMIPNPLSIAPLPPPITPNERFNHQVDSSAIQPTYAYQIPQQSNVGSESIFSHPSSASSSSLLRTRPVKSARGQSSQRGVSCPFYVVYLTNLAMQQKAAREGTATSNNENEGTPATILSNTRKVPVNSRMSTAHSGRSVGKRSVNSPLSVNTCSTLEEDERLTHTTMSAQRKRSSAKTTGFEKEDAPLLTNLLRMSSWNHAQV